jgi:hypothetical protein
MLLKEDTIVARATAGQFERELKVLDETLSDWRYREVYIGSDDAYGLPCAVIVALFWEEAYWLFLDSLPSLDPSEVHEAYGFDTYEDMAMAIEEDENSVELIDGYMYQSDGGIVCTMYTHLSPWCRDADIKLHIERV